MDSSCHKLYQDENDFDSRAFLETYFSDRPEMVYEDMSLKFPLKMLHNYFSSGHIKGDLLYDISAGPLVHHLYSACKFFKHIYVLKFSERCIMELKRWVDTRTGAFCWDHTKNYVTNMEGKSDQCEEKDVTLKTAIIQMVKCDFENENLADPLVLTQADCVISAWLLDLSSKDKNDYICTLRKMLKLLKSGGQILLFGNINATYYMIGQDRYHMYKHDEASVKQILRGEGLIIDQYADIKSKVVSDLSDTEAVFFIAAHKEK